MCLRGTRIYMHYVLLSMILICACHLSVTSSAQENATPSHNLPEPPRYAWMQTDTALQKPVALEIKTQPLRVILDSISEKTGVVVSASRDIREYRIALHTDAQPLAHVLARLEDLFGHGKLPNAGYQWTRIVADKQPPRYLLERNARAVEEEAELLDSPRITAKRWMRETRDFLLLPSEKRGVFKSDSPHVNFLRRYAVPTKVGTPEVIDSAVTMLTDVQINALFRDNHVELPGFIVSDAAYAALQTVPKGSGVRPDFDDYTRPSQAYLQLASSTFCEGEFDIVLSFHAGFPNYCPSQILLNTLDALPDQSNEDFEEAQKWEQATPINLLAHEDAPAGKQPVLTLPVALSLLAREAKISIYSEAFLKRSTNLVVTQGKPEYLLSKICDVFACRWVKVGGDYLVTSKSWAQDRAGDVPQPLLDRWQASQQNHKGLLEPLDFLDMGRLMTAPQLATLALLFDSPSITTARTRNVLRFAATLDRTDFEAACGKEGVTLSTLSLEQTALLSDVFGRRQISLPLHILGERGSFQNGSNTAFVFDLTLTDQAGMTNYGRVVLGYQKADKP